MGGARHRASAGVGALAPAAHVVRDGAGRARGRARAGTELVAWYVGGERRNGTIAERDAIAERRWNAFVSGAEELLPHPHDPLAHIGRLARLRPRCRAERWTSSG